MAPTTRRGNCPLCIIIIAVDAAATIRTSYQRQVNNITQRLLCRPLAWLLLWIVLFVRLVVSMRTVTIDSRRLYFILFFLYDGWCLLFIAQWRPFITNSSVTFFCTYDHYADKCGMITRSKPHKNIANEKIIKYLFQF